MTSGEFLRRAWVWLTRTFAGRLLLVSLGIKAVVWTVRLATQSMTALSTLNSVATLLLLVAVVAIGYRSYMHAKRALLWRVRRKLTLSYVFIGFVPVLLLVVFFSIAGLLLIVNVGGYVLRTRMTTLVERAQALAQTAAADLAHVNGAADDGTTAYDTSRARTRSSRWCRTRWCRRRQRARPAGQLARPARSRWPAPGNTRRRRYSCRNGYRAPATAAWWRGRPSRPRAPGWPHAPWRG